MYQIQYFTRGKWNGTQLMKNAVVECRMKFANFSSKTVQTIFGVEVVRCPAKTGWSSVLFCVTRDSVLTLIERVPGLVLFFVHLLCSHYIIAYGNQGSPI